MGWSLIAGVGLVLALVLSVTLSPQPVDDPNATVSIPGLGAAGDYPPQWRATPEEIMAKAAFDFKFPSAAAANRSKITEAFLSPDLKAAALRFGVPEQSDAAKVRQPFIEVYYALWEGGDPAEDYARDIALDPAIGKRVIDLNGRPALVVDAQSPSDAEQANPAFLRFVVNDVEIQVSGGTNLERIIGIARSMS